MDGWIRSRTHAALWRLVRPALLAAAMAFSASAALACPDWQMTGQTLMYSADQLRSPATHSVVAGGSDRLADCPEPGHGYVSTRPSFDLTFTGSHGAADLVLRVNATCDSVLLVNDANGRWHFDDDGGDGLNALLRIPNAPDGVYDIWVGTYGSSTCQATLTLESGIGGQPPQAQCPDPGQNGQMLTFDGQGLWVPQRFSVVAGGNIDLGACGTVPGHGHIIQSPDFTLNFTANPQNHALEFRVDGTCDPVLLVHDATGQWHFNDDADGLNSRLRIDGARPGLYDIWVGTYGASTCQATLIAETFSGHGDGTPPPQNVLPDPGNLTGYRGQVGQTFTFQTTGTDSGTVWGSDIYTDDSSLGRAAVHAGLLQVGQTGTVQVEILPGQQSYQGSTRNGVQSANYGSWSGSYRFVQTGAPSRPDGQIQARLMAVIPDSGRDLVGRGESMAPNGEIDSLFRVAVTAPGQVLTQIEVRNTTGPLSIWDTIPNTNWVGLAMVNGQGMNRADTSVGIPMGAGETVLDYYVQQNGAVGRDGMRMTLGFASGARTAVEIPAGFVGYVPDTRPGQIPAADGLWSINANGYVGELELDWNGQGFGGSLTFGSGQLEILRDVSFDAATGAVRFTRILQSITQDYRGFLANDRLSGQFNQNGGGYVYGWTATRMTPAPAPTPVAPTPPAVMPGGAPGK